MTNGQEQAAPNQSHRRSSILVDLGRRSAKRIKQLRKGKGKLMKDVEQTIDELMSSGQLDETAQPVIVIVREKPSAPMMWNPFGMMK